MPRGGRRSGRPLERYPNRTDMQQGQRQPPIMRAPSRRYGDQAAQVAAQQAVRPGPQPVPTPAPASSTPPSLTSIVPLDAPTMRPDEPVTAGSPSGPGPGPAAPPLVVVTPDTPIGQMITKLAASSTAPELALLADYVESGRA